MSEPYMVSSTHKFSDGTETVVNYRQNESAEEIESVVAEAVAETSPEEIVESPIVEPEVVAETTE